MNYTVVGFFNDRDEAIKASTKLTNDGFSSEDVDLSPFSAQGDYTENDYDYEEEEETTGFWESLFGGDDDDKERKNRRDRYSRVGARNHVITVHTMDKSEADKAVGILDECGAIDVSEEDDKYTSQPGMTTGMNQDRDYDRDSDLNLGNDLDRDNDVNLGNDLDLDRDNDGDKTISVIDEELEVGKRDTETGGVRVRSRIVERPVEEHVRLRKERVYITRKPVDRELSDADAANFHDETIEMKEHAEKAVVSKKAHVKEEITVNKDVDYEDETINETVKETEVEIDDDSRDENEFERNECLKNDLNKDRNDQNPSV